MFKNHLWVSTCDNCLCLGYLTQNVFKLHPISCKIQAVVIFFCCVVLHCVNYHIFLNHYSVEGHLGCFQVLAVTNKAAMNIVEHMSLWNDWEPFGYIPKSDVTESWGRLFPNFLRNRHTDIQRGCTSLHSHQQCRSVPFSPQPLQHKLLSVFLILAILIGVKWNLRIVLICISLGLKMLNLSLSVFQSF